MAGAGRIVGTLGRIVARVVVAAYRLIDLDDLFVVAGLSGIAWGVAQRSGAPMAAIVIGSALVGLAVLRLLLSVGVDIAARSGRRTNGGT